MSLEPDA